MRHCQDMLDIRPMAENNNSHLLALCCFLQHSNLVEREMCCKSLGQDIAVRNATPWTCNLQALKPSFMSGAFPSTGLREHRKQNTDSGSSRLGKLDPDWPICCQVHILNNRHLSPKKPERYSDIVFVHSKAPRCPPILSGCMASWQRKFS